MALASALRDIERIGASRVNPYAERAPEMAHLYITNPLRRGGLDSLFRTHPRTEDRIKALMAFAQERGLGTRPRAAATGQGRGPWG
jgi:heat shock protein HtpX